MSSSFSPRHFLPALALLAMLLAPACTAPRTASTTAPDPLATLTYDGSQQTLESLDRDIAAAGQDPQKLAAISTRLFAIFRNPAATGDARQAVSQRLALFPAATLTAGENPALFAAMFADERQVNFVRLILDDVSGDAVDAIFLRGLDASTPATRLAFVQSIGNRRIAAAVPKLTPLLADSDAAIVAAATKALGQIGTPDALAALKAAPVSLAVVEARLVAAHHLGGAAAVHEFQSILDTPAAPAHLRAAALHGLLFAEPDAAPARIVAVLSGHDAAFKPVVIEAIFSLRSKDLVPTLLAQLANWDTDTQIAVITALGRRGEAAATSAVAAATQHADAAVRTAAITALGRLPGNADIAALLVRFATGENTDDAKLARQSLARLDGPGVADAVIAGATNADTAQRIVYLDQIAARNMTAAIPLLFKTREAADASVRIAALSSLAELAPASDQRAILDWTIAATDAAEQARGLRTLAAVTLRNPDVAARAQLIVETIDQSPAAVSLRLLPVLPRIGGTATAECAGRLALRNDATLANAATTTLSRWTDSAGLLPLVVVAEKAPLDSVRAAAVTGATSYLAHSPELSSENLRSLVTRLLAATTDGPARARLVYRLSRCADAEALALVEKLKAEPALTADATDAALAIRSNHAGQPALTASAGVDQLPHILDGKVRTGWGVQATANQWIQADFHSPRPFRQIVLDGGGSEFNYPEHVELFVTDDPKNPGDAKASADGRPGKVTLDLPAGTRGRYLVIRHSKAREDSWWVLAELVVD